MTIAPAGLSTSEPGPDTGLLGLVTLLVRWRGIFIGLTLAFGVLGFAVAKLNRTWSVEATIRPQGPSGSPSRLAGLAAQFGFTLPGAPVGDPVRFYAELLQSREVLGEAVALPVSVATGRGGADSLRGTFLDFYHVTGVDSADRARRGRELLRSLMTVTTDREAGFVRLKLVTKWPDLSLQLGSQVLALTSAASISKQQSQAVAERTFVEARMKDAQRALEEAETNLERFLTQNRLYQSSPLLTLQFGRLQRRVELRQQVFVGLAQAYEQARIDEVRDTPVLMVVDGVEGSLRPARRASLDALLWMLVGGGCGFLLVLGLDGFWRFRRERPGRVEALLAELRRTGPLGWRRPR
jgi:uncharacterized protein involved in exopolysaccharide biosynthesis